MTELLVSAFGCLLLGLMSTLHPCPLATNMAAVSMIVSSPGDRRKFGVSVAFFAAGFMISMMCLAVIINISLSSIVKISLALQNIISLFLGPVLILAGMLTSGLLKFGRQHAFKVKKLNKGSFVYIFSLGMLLALAFCPATASLYFGVLIPLSLKFDQTYLFPLLYAFGSVLPIVGMGYLIKTGGDHFMRGRWARSITRAAGFLLIAIGVYISLQRLYLP